MGDPKKGPKTRHKILTLYYDDEGDGKGIIFLETPHGTVCVNAVPPNSINHFNWTQTLTAGSSSLYVQSTFNVSSLPREPLVVLAEETLAVEELP